MKRFSSIFITSFLMILMITLPVVAQGDDISSPISGRDLQVEQEIHKRLAALNPEAVPIFQAATQALDKDDLKTARQAYMQVLQLAPDFPDALRRLSYIELAENNIQAALETARQAFAADGSAYNHIALAQMLLATENPDHTKGALLHAQAAVAALPDDPEANLILLHAAMSNGDEPVIRQTLPKVLELAPDNPLSHYFAGLVAAHDGYWEEAQQELHLSQALGMPPQDVQLALNSGIMSQAKLYGWARRGTYTIFGWLLGFPVLFLVGIVLSRLTLAAVSRSQNVLELEPGAGERVVRSLYRFVILLTSLYFYISIPLLILIIIVGAGGILIFFMELGQIPVGALMIVGVGAIYTIYTIIRSLFIRWDDTEPGEPLEPEDAPKLWALTEEVADRINTRPIDTLYITPGVEIAVVERGKWLKKLAGNGERCLILGLGALPGLTQNQFKAILAHEYGHFSNRDTAGGNLAIQVQASFHTIAYGLAVNGQAVWYNPAWLFVNGFSRIFFRITLGASRLQEVLADRYAVIAYGTHNFIEGLTHVVQRNLIFNLQAGSELKHAMQFKKAVPNLYRLPPLDPNTLQTKIEPKLGELLNRSTSAYDSHPALKDRFALAKQLDIPSHEADSPEPVWSLFANPEEWQGRMTTHIYENVRYRWVDYA